MAKARYMISDASKEIKIEPHVLRYWEEELDLVIPRNDMGHRYYSEEDLNVFRGIRLLKERGFSLRAIKLLIPEMSRVQQLDSQGLDILKEELDIKVQELEMAEENAPKKHLHHEEAGTQPAKQLMKRLTSAEQEEWELEPSGDLDEGSSIEEKMEQFRQIIGNIVRNTLLENNSRLAGQLKETVTDGIIKEVDYMLRVQEEREEERYQKLEEVFTESRKSRREVAAAMKKKKRFFRKKSI